MYRSRYQCGGVHKPSSMFLKYWTNNSTMIQKLDKRALAMRIFGKDTEDVSNRQEGEVEPEIL